MTCSLRTGRCPTTACGTWCLPASRSISSTVRPGSLEYFLTERYCLYAVDHQSRPYRLEIHHPAWRLETADAEIAVNTMADAAGIRLPPTAPLLHFSKRQDTVCWAPEKIG